MTPQELVQEARSLFILPEAALRLEELMRQPYATLQDMAEVIEKDAGLTATVLRMVNSAYYGLSGRVGSIPLALNLLGQQALRSLVLAVSVTRVFKGLPADLVDMQSFWENSTTCAAISRALARRLQIGQGEELFLAGLLHGVGRLVFFARRPLHYRQILDKAGHGIQAEALAERERHLFGFDHADLGAALLAAWRLPPMLVTAVGYQLRPLAAPAHAKETAILHVAQDMAAQITSHLKTGQEPTDYEPAFDPAAATLLGLDPTCLPEVRAAALLEAVEILEIVNPRATLIY